MPYRKLSLSSLIVNPANDRHGELENETAAIAQLFAAQEQHMRTLAKDLVNKGEVFEPPLVFPSGQKFVVADGNRRTTCLKLLAEPRRAPTVELQQFFSGLRAKWRGKFPERLECRVETDRDRVDDILFRRHTGVQGGVGQSTWNDRMKSNFVIRTGKSTGINVADEIESRLKTAKMTPQKRIPRSNLNRLLSAEAIRHRVGISVKKGQFEFIRDESASLAALQRIASDLANKKVTLDDIWNTESKLKYIDGLDAEGILPKASQKPKARVTTPLVVPPPTKPTRTAPAPTVWPHLIPNVDYGLAWPSYLQRHHEIWEELQFRLDLTDHPNACSVLLRVLLELAIENYIVRAQVTSVHQNDKLANRASKVAAHMRACNLIDQKYLGIIRKLEQGDEIISIDTLNRYVHSPNFNVSPEHLKMLWKTLSGFIVLCLKA